MHIVAVPVLGIIFNIFLQCIEANLKLDFKVTKISANHKPANCIVVNTTYSHGETFKLDCKTQCVCENGRHACSSLCPKEQLPAPEDTISCRSPRLVEVPGHCCKMWLCENPTADVYATCHNSSTSPWTPCSRECGLGISTRFTTTTAGCNQLSNLRLCENRKCETQQENPDKQNRGQYKQHKHAQGEIIEEKLNRKYFLKSKQLKHKLKREHRLAKQHQTHRQPMRQEHSVAEHRIRKGHECRSLQRLGSARVRLGQCVSKKLYRPKICGRCHQNTKCCVPSVSTTIQVELFCPLNAMDPISFVQQQLKSEPQQHHGQLFYPKTSTSATSSSPSSSLSTMSSLTSLWDTQSLDAIDQEYLQSHQIQIANKFIAVEWILKCECTKTDNCQRIVNTTTTLRADDKKQDAEISSNNSNFNINNHHKYHEYDDNDDNGNVETGSNSKNNKNMQNINYFKLNNKNKLMFYNEYKQLQPKAETDPAAATSDKIPDNNNIVDEQNHRLIEDKDWYENENNEHNDIDININNVYSNSKRGTHTHLHSFNHKKQAQHYAQRNKNNNKSENMINNRNNNGEVGGDDDDNDEEIANENEWSTPMLSAPSMSSSSSSSSSSTEIVGGVATASDETQPDIIPYPPPPFSANSHTSSSNNNYKNSSNHKNTKNSNKNTPTNWIKEKFKLENSKQTKQQQQQPHYQQKQKQQQIYEHWLLQQYSNKPYDSDSSTT